MVLGHAFDGLMAAGLAPWNGPISQLHDVIYLFHMPLFFFLAGLLVDQRLRRKGRVAFLRDLIPGVVAPYLIWAPIAVATQVVFSGVTNVARSDLAGSLISILSAPVLWLWFLYALCGFHLLAVLGAGRARALLVASVVAYPVVLLFAVPEIVGRMIEMAPFYALGVVMGPWLIGRQPVSRPGLIVALTLGFTVLAWLGLALHVAYWTLAAIPAAIVGVALAVALSQTRPIRTSGFLIFVGRRSLPIFLLHVFFVAGSRIVLHRLFGIDAVWALAPVLIAAGLIGPLLVYAVATRLGLSVFVGLGRPEPRRRIERDDPAPSAA